MRRYLVFALCSPCRAAITAVAMTTMITTIITMAPSYGGWPSDFNVDGFADILVARPRRRRGPGSDRGRVFLYAAGTPGGVADGVYDGPRMAVSSAPR